MKTTKRHFKLFCAEVTKQCKRLGLQEWRLDFIHGRYSTADCISELDVSYTNRAVGVYFNHKIPTDILTDEFVLRTAKHEAIELLVDDVVSLHRELYITENQVIATRHTLVRRLEKVL